MDLFDAIVQRASVRNLKAVEVTEEDLSQVLDAGRRAPSGYNRQPWEIIVVRDAGLLEGLAESQGTIAAVNTALVVVADPGKSEYWVEDVAAAVENMLLAITALGYASVWIEGTVLRNEAKHKQELGVPDHMRLYVVLPLGVAAEPTEQAEKRALDEFVHEDRYRARS
jgi:nitroreductase